MSVTTIPEACMYPARSNMSNHRQFTFTAEASDLRLKDGEPELLCPDYLPSPSLTLVLRVKPLELLSPAVSQTGRLVGAKKCPFLVLLYTLSCTRHRNKKASQTMQLRNHCFSVMSENFQFKSPSLGVALMNRKIRG